MTNTNNTANANGGIGFFGLLAILFVGLKLTHYIDWSWWWVLAPLWGPLAVVLAVLGVGAFIYALILGIAAVGDAVAERKRQARRAETDRLIKATSKTDKP